MPDIRIAVILGDGVTEGEHTGIGGPAYAGTGVELAVGPHRAVNRPDPVPVRNRLRRPPAMRRSA